MIQKKSARHAHLLLRVRVLPSSSGSNRLLLPGITTGGSSSSRRRLHLLDLLGSGAGGTAAQQVPGRPSRASELAIGSSSSSSNSDSPVLLPFLAVLPVGSGLGRGLAERAGGGLVRPDHRLPLEARADGGGRRRRARQAPHVLEEQRRHGVCVCARARSLCSCVQ